MAKKTSNNPPVDLTKRGSNYAGTGFHNCKYCNSKVRVPCNSKKQASNCEFNYEDNLDDEEDESNLPWVLLGIGIIVILFFI
jgi:hypothetical protein